jgi:hypothetical protein
MHYLTLNDLTLYGTSIFVVDNKLVCEPDNLAFIKAVNKYVNNCKCNITINVGDLKFYYSDKCLSLTWNSNTKLEGFDQFQNQFNTFVKYKGFW